MTITTKPEIYQFRDCEMDTVERFLKENGKRVELTTREFDTLLCLVENAGRIVTHDELLNSVWGENNLNVEQSNLPVQVSRIRKAMGETRTERYIETVHGMSYRLLASVRVHFPEAATP
jgi:DNA-binding winged helix-turn-helix (wHTH) protein